MSTTIREALEKAFQQSETKIEEPANTDAPQEAVSNEPEQSQDSQESQSVSEESPSDSSKDSKPAKAVSGDESAEDVNKLSADIKSQKADAKGSKQPQEQKASQPAPEIPQDVPPFWKAEDKAMWSKVPPEVRQIVRKYEDSRNAAVTRFKQIINEKIGQWSDASWDEVFPAERLRALKLEGKTPAQVTQSLWAWSDYLEEDPVGAITEMIHKYQLTPEQLFERHKNTPPPQQPIQDPRVDQLIQQQQAQLEQQNLARMKQELDAFGMEKQNGQPLRPYWNEVKQYIKHILPLVYSENPDITDYEALHMAYERAVYANPQVRTKLVTTNNQVKFSDEKTQRAKEAASASITGSSSRTAEQPKTARTARDALAMAWSQHSR